MGKTVVGVIEDDPVHSEIVAVVLEQAGFSAVQYGSALEFRRHASPGDFDLLLVDWDLPGESGLDFLRNIREAGLASVPVIFVTAMEDEARIVEALSRGADDYIVKPAKSAELVARVRTVLRRAGSTPSQANALIFPPFEFDASSLRLTVDGNHVHLTPREFEMSLFLFRRAGRIVSREALLTQVWGVSRNVDTRSIDTYASRLRKRLGLDGSSGWRLEGIYQHGYRLSRHGAVPDALDESAL